MKRILFPAVLAAVLLPALACAAAPLRIVTTTSDLAAIARAVAGGHATVRSICTGKEDPHFIQAKPGFILAARDADLWVRIGLDLETAWESPILEGCRNRHIRVGSPGHLDASEGIIPREAPLSKVTRAEGDVHPYGNPHYWLDPWNGRVIAGEIAERLARLRPAEEKTFRDNLAAFQRALDDRMFGAALVKAVGGETLWRATLDGSLERELAAHKGAPAPGGWLDRLAPLRGAKFISHHRTWAYLAARFGLEIVAELEPKPGIPPTAGHLSEVVELVREQGVKFILLEAQYGRAAADRVAARTRVPVIVCPTSVGGDPAATDYLSLLDLIVDRIAAAR